MTTYLLAGGGTAGHVNPLLAVADALRVRDPESVILILGTAEGLEARLVPDRGFELLTVPRLPFPRRLNGAAIRFPARWEASIRQVRRYLRERRVDVVFGVGGYAAAPAYIAAKRERIPFVVHEANARPGLANVLGARAAHSVGIAFAGTPLRRGQLVGMPLRPEIENLDRAALRDEAMSFFHLDSDKPTVLVFGGSLGARRLNEAIAQTWRDVLAAGWQLIHVTGERSEIVDPHHDGYTVLRYVDRMDLAFAAADLVVCRSGASTVSEVSALGIPAVYVPYAVGNGEQRLNAASSVDAGAAVVIDDADFTAETVRTMLIPLLRDAARLDAMRRAARDAGISRGTARVVELIDAAHASAAAR